MNTDEQLKKWVAGESLCPNDDGECCPDFSCCKPELQSDERTRQVFLNADEELRLSMLGTFMGKAFELAGHSKIYIAGIDDPNKVGNA